MTSNFEQHYKKLTADVANLNAFLVDGPRIRNACSSVYTHIGDAV